MFAIIGSGGHAKVVIDALTSGGVALAEIAVRDLDAAREGQTVGGIAVVTPDIDQSLQGQAVHIAIGSCEARARLAARLSEISADPATIRHPHVKVAASALIGSGSFIAAGALVGPDATIGAHVIINHNAVVDHDCIVGDFAHIAPNATLGGGVSVGARTLIGSGAVVLPGVAVGNDAVIGAGAVVTANVGAGETWVGNPARKQG